MAKQQYDRAAEDLGNIVALEHVNLQVPNQTEATGRSSNGTLTGFPANNSQWVAGRNDGHFFD